MAPPAPAAEILLEDDELLAVVKPAGLPTANAARGTASLFTILQAARPRGFLGVVSRLDAAVSGVVVFAKTRSAAADLARQFRERLVEKRYEAIVEGRFPAALGQWVDWHDRLARDGQERRSRLFTRGKAKLGLGEDAVDDAGVTAAEDAAGDESDGPVGSACHVRARVVERRGEVSLVELVPTTGRRHQLRAQLSARGCPIVGDRTYGARLPLRSGARAADRTTAAAAIALHSRRLAIDHPATRLRLVLEAARPRTWLERFPSLFPAGDSRRRGE